MHLAIDAGDGSIAVQSDRRVVIKPRCAALEERSNDRDAIVARNLRKLLRRRPGNRLGQVE